jgi:LacI family transcriptional regulator
MITIKEIAQKAGVSATTVSNVLNGNTGKVSLPIREKIEAILVQENYAPNMGAHILARKNSRTVGVIIFMEPRGDETVLEDPFSSTILGAIEAELHSNGYYMMLLSTSDKDEVFRLSSAWKLAGLILLFVPKELIRSLQKKILSPTVFVDSNIRESLPGCLSVGLEDYAGGYKMGRYLISMGHREIVFVANDNSEDCSDYNRFSGFQKAFEDEGLILNNDHFIPLSMNRSQRIDFYDRLATKPFPYSCIAFSADYYAVEAINRFQEQGRDIPADISVSGFDDNIYSRIIRPRLTTVHQDVRKKGTSAVNLLIRAIEKGEPQEFHEYLPVRLEIRDSVGRI